MDNLIGSLKNYGLVEGLSLYLKLKNFKIDSIETSKLPHKVHLRPGSTDNCVFKQIFLKQDFNIPVLIQPDTILDLGANIGMSSLYFAERFKSAKIVGVEPDEDNGRMFKKNLLNYPNVSFELAAIRGDNRKVEIKDYGKGASGYVVEENVDGLPAVTVSDIMKKYGWKRIDLLKMDIEGSEKSVFEGDISGWLPMVKVLFVGCVATTGLR